MAGLCGFDRHRLDSGTVAELECLHPLSNTNSAGFRLHACSRPGPTGSRCAASWTSPPETSWYAH